MKITENLKASLYHQQAWEGLIEKWMSQSQAEHFHTTSRKGYIRKLHGEPLEEREVKHENKGVMSPKSLVMLLQRK